MSDLRFSVERREGEVATVCTNKRCFAQELQKLLHFVSKNAVDIRGLGDKIMELLLNQGLVREAADLFKLKKEDLFGLPGFAEQASSAGGGNSITTKHPIDRFINSLGIRHIGEETARDLVAAFGTFEKLCNATKRS